jgi:glycosyltransferase involved in cell wall biosynthesis
MAAGKPLIATRVGAVPKLIDAQQTGLLLEPGDVDGLAAAILRLLGDPDLASSLGENGRAKAVRHFSAAAMARSYLGQYEQVLASRRHRNPKQAALKVSAR